MYIRLAELQIETLLFAQGLDNALNYTDKIRIKFEAGLIKRLSPVMKLCVEYSQLIQNLKK